MVRSEGFEPTTLPVMSGTLLTAELQAHTKNIEKNIRVGALFCSAGHVGIHNILPASTQDSYCTNHKDKPCAWT